MNKNQELLVWKAVAVAAALLYLYKVAKANGGTLEGNNLGINVNPEKVVHLASQFVPQEFRPKAREVGMKVWDHMSGGQNG